MPGLKFDRTLSPEIAQRYKREGYWIGKNLIEYFDAAVARHPDKTAIVGGDARLTYGQLATEVNRVAHNLRALGVGPGDVVSVQLFNTPEFVMIHLAASRLGAVTNPLLHNYRASELTYILALAQSKVAIIPQFYRKFDYPGMYAGMWPELPALEHVFVLGGSGLKGMRPFDELTAPLPADACERVERGKEGVGVGTKSRTRSVAGSGTSAAVRGRASLGETQVPTAATTGDDITALIFTSGTESKPKGVMHSHDTQMYGTLWMAKLLGLTGDDIVWAPSPISHGTGFQWGVREAITLGATLVLQDIWSPDEALKLIARERCTFTLGATPFAAMLMESPLVGSLDLSSFRIFACAGAAIPHQLGVDMRQKIGCTLVGMWGMTECFVGSASAPDAPDDKLWGTDGCAMPGGELAIFDETRSKTLPPGEVGELAARGPFVALGYFGDPERSRETFTPDGWLFSNDLATIDADGYIRLVGRKKEIVNRGGLKISVRQMEDYLVSHPKILSVAIVGVPDRLLGEKSCACIVPRGNQAITLREITDFLDARQVAKYKFPEYLVTLPEMPTTPSGKIQKFVLRDNFVKCVYSVASIATSP